MMSLYDRLDHRSSGGQEDLDRGRRLLLVIVGTLIARLTSPPMGAADQVTGTVETRVHAGGAPATAVVYAEPLDQAVPVRPGTFTVVQKNKSFAPNVLGVPAGSSVAFPNEDSIFHNVFSLSNPQPFDLGLYRSGASKTRTFTQAAVYHVFCNIHPQMAAFVVVAPSPWVTTTARDGSWRLDLPAGRYRITALSERAAPVTVEVTIGPRTGEAPVLMLEESKTVQTEHLNKFGKPYPTSAYKDR
jgi:plastocyanin